MLVYQVVLPGSLVPVALQSLHNDITGGHLGVDRLREKVRVRFFWPGWGNEIEQWVRQCEACNMYKTTGTAPRAPMCRVQAFRPFEKVGIDLIGLLPIILNGHHHIMVIVDYFSKWAEAFPIPDKESSTATKILVEPFI